MSEEKPHCGNCDYFFHTKNLPFGVCEVDLGDAVPAWGWWPAWTERGRISGKEGEKNREGG